MNVLSLVDVAVVRSGRALIGELTCSVEPGKVLAITGPSGAGKSTLLRVIAGLESLARGYIDVSGVRLIAGEVPPPAMQRELYRRLGMVFQFHHLFEHLSVLENLCLAPIRVRRESRSIAVSRARALLEEFGLAHRERARPHQLSGGEAQRIAIARALALEPSLLLMDEPTASLDADRRMDLVQTLRRNADRGRSLVVASHDAAFVDALADMVIVLDNGPTRVERRGTEVS